MYASVTKKLFSHVRSLNFVSMCIKNEMKIGDHEAFGVNFWLFLSKSLGVKKPAGTAEEIERHFGCESSKLIMVDEMN